MAINETKLGDQESEIIKQIGDLLPALYYKLKRKPKTVALRESFDVWELDIDRLKEAMVSRQLPVYQAGYQHHQIQIGRRAKAYALSQELPSGAPKVFEVALSKIAERIDEAIDRLDKETGDNTVAQLLIAQPCQVYAFRLIDRDKTLADRQKLYIISAPVHFTNLRSGEYFDIADFLRTLDKEIGPRKPKGEWREGQLNVAW